MNEVQLFIQGQRVELFKDETIEVTDSIQNVRDIARVFTAYSAPFTVPASRNNNQIFKHFYNADIINGFDARRRVAAEIKLNGVTYKRGKIRLDSVRLKDNKADSYSLVFFGETVELTDLLGDDELKDLPYLNNYNHEYSNANVYAGLTGLDLNGDTDAVYYPLLIYTEPFEVASGVFRRVSDGSDLDYTDLKPAIRLIHIIEAIEDKYGISFDSTFFTAPGGDFFRLFMALHRNKGPLRGADNSVLTLLPADFDLVSGDDLLASPLIATRENAVGDYYRLDYDITVVGSGQINVRVIDVLTGDVLATAINDTGAVNVIAFLNAPPTVGERTFVPQLVVESESGVTGLTITLNIERYELFSGFPLQTGAYDTTPGTLAPISEIIITDQMPKMKVIDFLTSIFKMFNLTAFVQDDGSIAVQPLNSFLNAGITRDITRYVDVNESEVSRANIYRTYDFKFQDPTTLIAKEQSEVNGTIYGDLEYTLSNDFEGDTYEVEVGFEKIVSTRLTDTVTGNISVYAPGFVLDKDLNPIETKPMILYVVPQVGAVPFEGQSDTIVYPRPSNSFFDLIDGAQETINFGAEVDEYTLETNNNSLFARFYESYVVNNLDVRSRILRLTAYLPLNFLLSYKLNDTIIIAGRQYKINQLSLNLQTGKAELELINRL